MDTNKTLKTLYVVIGFLFVAVLGLSGYIIYDKAIAKTNVATPSTQSESSEDVDEETQTEDEDTATTPAEDAAGQEPNEYADDIVPPTPTLVAKSFSIINRSSNEVIKSFTVYVPEATEVIEGSAAMLNYYTLRYQGDEINISIPDAIIVSAIGFVEHQPVESDTISGLYRGLNTYGEHIYFTNLKTEGTCDNGVGELLPAPCGDPFIISEGIYVWATSQSGNFEFADLVMKDVVIQ